MSHTLNPLREVGSYSAPELERASVWPAVDRYLRILERARTNTGSSNPLTEIQKLKVQRHEAWLQCALALFHENATDEEICFSWSRAADKHIQAASHLSGLAQTETSIFALGKLGADELNLSSDIDLMFVIPDDSDPPHKEAREFIRILNEVDEWGFCHRVDMALRPGGSAATLLPTTSQFENHYGYHGEAWERLAFVRFRHIAGGNPDDVLKFARAFSYRRHLDYSVFEELRILINRIRRENPTERSDEFHLKLHPGGIRDIELFTHALQTIHGGRRKDLQTHRTTLALEKLSAMELISSEEAKTLSETYWFYRNLENRLQAETDEQLYRFKGNRSENKDDFAEVNARAKAVIKISSSVFPDVKTAKLPSVEELTARGFDKDIAEASLEEIRQTKVLSRKSERDEREKDLFLSSFLESLEKSGGDLNLGLGLLVDFVKNTRAKATLFSLLNREPLLIQQLATLFGVSPWAGQILGSRPELLDAFILRQEATQLDQLDTDQALDALSERRLLGELIATLHFLESKDLEACTKNLTDLADSIATDLMRLTARELGCEPLGIVALGKWGGRELGVRSDLDFVFLTETPPTNDQQRLARRFLNRMTEAHRGGALYAVDLRLRPSGHAGPILVQVEHLREHMKTSAQPWERQSWLRARSLPDLPHPLPKDIRQIILSRGLSPTEAQELADIALKLFKPIPVLDETTTSRATLDLKLVNGGLAPIEFAAQISVLRAGPTASRPDRNLLPGPETLETSTHDMIHFLEGLSTNSMRDWGVVGPSLRETHLWLRRIEQWIRVTSDVAGSNLNLGSKEFARFAKTAGEDPKTFPARLTRELKKSDEHLRMLLGR